MWGSHNPSWELVIKEVGGEPSAPLEKGRAVPERVTSKEVEGKLRGSVVYLMFLLLLRVVGGERLYEVNVVIMCIKQTRVH